jgi:hypothetical protein
MRKRKLKLPGTDVIVPIGIVVVLSFLAFASLEQTIGRSSETVREIARGGQRAIIKSALAVIGIVGAARLALGFVGGPIMWAITGAAWILSGGFDIVASQLGFPTFGGIMGGIRNIFRGGAGGTSGECPPGTIRMDSGHCGQIRVM